MALDCGVSVREYWDLTLQEIHDIVESYGRTYKRKRKERIEDLFVLAEVNANRVLNGLSGKASASDYIQPWHMYPDLFENLEERFEEEQERKELELYKARFNKGVDAWNRRFREAHSNDDRRNAGEAESGQ